ncbi:MAG: bifunctional 4-hydroxy-2-oxoglutarate aldolase/2-dehydro-3-deoxy-phosphogluconate aldolase [Candidatus Kapabacteria bacterium]|jgi:2-dehydro-3-deoxyphosphogluconate aldolase/(4S)-4-hydroxy-2-oxoglutarate aldolase|nr:bifunctional 4-hydroxy-2-oxoglutarate aldolase/2-dehydro-3-deoxy-phosphogluconate aldolase [Candidatus Kapabacteria bacterium]
MTKNEILSTVLNEKAVAVIRLPESIHALLAVEAIVRGGMRLIEITLTTPDALKIIAKLRETLPNAIIGAGSVLNSNAAAEVIHAGAQFVVSPVMKPVIIEECQKHEIAGMIGAFSPTEILTAQEVGADIVKLSPAEFFGPAFIKSVKAPMPHLRIMPTGGITLTNGKEWLKAGACAVGVGSALCDVTAVQAQNFEQLTLNAETVVQSLQN